MYLRTTFLTSVEVGLINYADANIHIELFLTS